MGTACYQRYRADALSDCCFCARLLRPNSDARGFALPLVSLALLARADDEATDKSDRLAKPVRFRRLRLVLLPCEVFALAAAFDRLESPGDVAGDAPSLSPPPPCTLWPEFWRLRGDSSPARVEPRPSGLGDVSAPSVRVEAPPSPREGENPRPRTEDVVMGLNGRSLPERALAAG